MEHKLKTIVTHSFGIESDLMGDVDFSFGLTEDKIKKKAKVVEVSVKSIIKTNKFKKDASTKLF